MATVTYEDVNGNTYSAQSNEAVITVRQVYSAEISADTAKEAAAGQTVYIQHTLTNTGNGEDKYTLTAGNDPSITDDINADSVRIFLDENGNGLADAGEQEISEVILLAGESAEIVLAVAVPNSAAPAQELGVILTAQAQEGTGAPIAESVIDTTTGKGTDGLDDTNQDLITITQNAVLNYTKAAVWQPAPDPANINPADNTTWPGIVYTLTITNTGNQAATTVDITDVVPYGMVGIDSSIILSGLTGDNGDTLPTGFTATSGVSEGGIDYNNDGDPNGTLTTYTIEATDASIAPGQTVSIQFTAKYDPYAFNTDTDPGSAGDIVKNTASLTANLDGDAGTTEAPITTNPTQTVLPQIYGVTADDTETGADNLANDGGDDDDNSTAALADTQTVDSVPSGATVLFNVILTNNGTGPDTLELAIARGDFPPGTTFTYWNATGTAQLTNTNSEGSVDTGMLDAGESITIMVKAQLPTNATDANSDPAATGDLGTGYTATLTATSSVDPAATPSSDTVLLKLGSITAPGVDIADNAGGIVAGNEDPALTAAATAPYLTGVRTDSEDGIVGSTVKLPIYIDNESGSSDSYQLTTGPLPTGWSVRFYQAQLDGSGAPVLDADGKSIRSEARSPALPCCQQERQMPLTWLL
ncbi:MAG: hypothetical protein R3E89_10750 [Thiolinea sp.]